MTLLHRGLLGGSPANEGTAQAHLALAHQLCLPFPVDDVQEHLRGGWAMQVMKQVVDGMEAPTAQGVNSAHAGEGAAPTTAQESKRMKRLRMVMKKAVDTTVNAMLTRDLQATLEPLQTVVGGDAFSQLLSIEENIAKVFKQHAEQEFEVACDEYQLGEKFLRLDGHIEEASRREAASHPPKEQESTARHDQMDVSLSDPEEVLRACRVQEKLQERAFLEQFLAQEVQGLKQREERLGQTSGQVEAVVRELSLFTDRLEEAMKEQAADSN